MTELSFAGYAAGWAALGTLVDLRIIEAWVIPRDRDPRGLVPPLAAINLLKTLFAFASVVAAYPLASEALKRILPFHLGPMIFSTMCATTVVIQSLLLHATYRGHFFSGSVVGTLSLRHALLLSIYCGLGWLVLASMCLFAPTSV